MQWKHRELRNEFFQPEYHKEETLLYVFEGLKAFPNANKVHQTRTKVDQYETDLKSALTMFDIEKTANKTCREAAW